jgi:hypothetical protein
MVRCEDLVLKHAAAAPATYMLMAHADVTDAWIMHSLRDMLRRTGRTAGLRWRMGKCLSLLNCSCRCCAGSTSLVCSVLLGSGSPLDAVLDGVVDINYVFW